MKKPNERLLKKPDGRHSMRPIALGETVKRLRPLVGPQKRPTAFEGFVKPNMTPNGDDSKTRNEEDEQPKTLNGEGANLNGQRYLSILCIQQLVFVND
jgi:hypothetical protein